MGKKGKKVRRSNAIPVGPLLPVGYRVVEAALMPGSIAAKLNHFSTTVFGFMPSTGQFVPDRAAGTWIGTGVGILAHKVANSPKTRINYYLRKATFGLFQV